MRHLPFAAALALLTSLVTAGPAAAQSVAEILKPKSGKVIFVRKKGGKNKNPGTKDAPMKALDKALEKSKPGDTIVVAGGRYKGTFGVGVWEIGHNVRIYGSFDESFTKRSTKTPTVLMPAKDRFDKSGVKPFMTSKPNVNLTDFVIDGLVFDAGEMTPYEASKGKPEGVATGMMKIGPGSKNPEGFCLALRGGNLKVKNNVFVNCAGGGLRLSVTNAGDAVVDNNVFVANRYSAVNSKGVAASGAGKTIIRNNTILFTWSRLKDFASQGYGIEVLKKTPYVIENNISAMNIGPGIASLRFNNALTINNNLFWGNKKKDFWFNPKSNVDVKIDAAEFEDLEIDNEGNENKATKIPVDPAYTAGVISASYSEKVDYDENSPANFMRELFGLNKQGKIKSKVTMFANRYPEGKAIELFGAVKGKGAQAPFKN